MSAVSDEIRMSFKASDDKRDAGLTTPENVKRYDDIRYADMDECQLLDVYRPKDVEGRLPVIINVHGGGWVYGSKEVYQFYCMSLAQRGFAVVNFTYRLAPEHKFPASLEDTNLVIKWILANAGKYQFDAGNIFMVGDSAGAHAAGLYAAICSNEAYRREYPFEVPQGFCPKAVALNCGIYNVVTAGHGQTEELMSDLLPEHGTRKELSFINVLEHVTKDFPPVFLMTANGDFLRAEAPRLAKKLVEELVPFTMSFYGTAGKELGHVFHCDMRLEEAHRCNDDECAFFRSFL